MSLGEALRQRQIVLEHARRANDFERDYSVEDIDYFDDELREINARVETLWLERGLELA